MSRKLGQIIAVRENTWMIRIPMGCDPKTKQRSYYNRTVHGSLRQAQKFLERRSMNLEPILSGTARRFAWTNTSTSGSRRSNHRFALRPMKSYESLFAKYIRPSLGKKPLVGIRPLDVQGVYQTMSDRGLSPRTVQGAHWS